MHSAGTVTYPGNVEHAIGEVKGPTTYGGFVIATAAQHNPDTATTQVTFSHLTTDGVTVERDPFGIVRVKP